VPTFCVRHRRAVPKDILSVTSTLACSAMVYVSREKAWCPMKRLIIASGLSIPSANGNIDRTSADVRWMSAERILRMSADPRTILCFGDSGAFPVKPGAFLSASNLFVSAARSEVLKPESAAGKMIVPYFHDRFGRNPRVSARWIRSPSPFRPAIRGFEKPDAISLYLTCLPWPMRGVRLPCC
jgi:hypothetical protein